MAIYRLSASVIKRSVGRSMAGAVAYRTAQRVEDARTGEVHDYTRRRGVAVVGIMAPNSSPSWATDRQRLWAEVELAEKRKDAQLAREFQLALPKELTPVQNSRLVGEFARKSLVARGMIADVALHDMTGSNPHAHVLTTLRTIGPNGFGQKNRDWNSRETLNALRSEWAIAVNKHLESNGLTVRVDHRSYAALGIDREPMPKLGPVAAEMERRGVATERGNAARRVKARNAARQALDPTRTRDEREMAADVAHAPGDVLGRAPGRGTLFPGGEILSNAYMSENLSSVARYWKIARLDDGTIQLRNRTGTVTDFGDSIGIAITEGAIARHCVSAGLDIAQAKGWTSVQATGTDDFKLEAWTHASERGIEIIISVEDRVLFDRWSAEHGPKGTKSGERSSAAGVDMGVTDCEHEDSPEPKGPTL